MASLTESQRLCLKALSIKPIGWRTLAEFGAVTRSSLKKRGLVQMQFCSVTKVPWWRITDAGIAALQAAS